MDWTIRRAAAEDYEAVRELMALDFEFHRDARPDYFQARSEYARADFDALCAQEASIAWVAEAGGRAVALCFGRIFATEENDFCRARRIAMIEDLVTLPAHRGRGMARALIETAREQAARAGAQAVELCVWGFNERAARLYAGMGFALQYARMEMKLRRDD